MPRVGFIPQGRSRDSRAAVSFGAAQTRRTCTFHEEMVRRLRIMELIRTDNHVHTSAYTCTSQQDERRKRSNIETVIDGSLAVSNACTRDHPGAISPSSVSSSCTQHQWRVAPSVRASLHVLTCRSPAGPRREAVDWLAECA